MFAPATALNDSWLTDREKELIKNCPEIRRRIFLLFRYQFGIMAIFLIPVAALKIYNHFI